MTERRRYIVLLAVVASTAVVLSLMFAVPYIFTLTGFAGWALLGHVVTADDDAAGGWSNPDGKLPFPWAELATKAAIFLGLCLAIAAFPGLRALGGAG
ncbi:hypothetical protein [Dyella acidiphila]|uniref:Uncharacterized protein n=1 Tax=Dyella acidiphila TaxID=2775866 RepID=A0ABR9GG17_9GAMM|nr:hypothetical protein [Dyella acidiphila]MBE1162994.1 hypothetical protein [Dyella acidiphila]